MEVFHTHEYIDFLQNAKPEHITEAQVQHFNVIDDSPVFDGVFKFCQIYAGASIHGAQKLIQADYDIAINWAGGLHHAKKGQASGVFKETFVPDTCVSFQALVTQFPRTVFTLRAASSQGSCYDTHMCFHRQVAHSPTHLPIHPTHALTHPLTHPPSREHAWSTYRS